MHNLFKIYILKFTVLFVLVCSVTFAQTSFEQIAKPQANVNELLTAHSDSPRSNTYYLLALSYARKGDYVQASKNIQTGLQINPSNIRLINLKGAILARQGNLVLARRLFLNALRLDPKNRYANVSLANIEKQLAPVKKRSITRPTNNVQNIVQQPVAPVSQPKKETTKILEASYFISIKDKKRCYYNMKMLSNAYERFITKDPKQKGNFVPMEMVAEKFIPSVPICPDSGSYSLDDNEVSCSEHGKISIVGAEVKTVFTQFNDGMRDKLSRNYLDALKAFEQVVILYPMWSEAHFQLGDTLFRLGETDAAIIEMRKCLKGDPDNLDAQLLLANLYYKKGQKTAALNILDKVIVKHKGTVYSLAARSIAKSIRAGRNYYQVFPPN